MKIEIPKRVAENVGEFTGRVWLLPKLLTWWDDSHERVCLLTGGPGTGKSMVLAWLGGYGPLPEDPAAQEQISRIRKALKAAHFCQAASRNITPQAFAESIAGQLTGSVKGFADALAATLADRVQISPTVTARTVAAGGNVTGVSIGRIDLGALGDELSFDRAFTQPLKKLYASGHSEAMLLMVDALDEAQTYTGATLPDLLSRLADLPPQIRIFATTRDEPRVLKFFRGIPSFDLIDDAAPDIDDVRTYAEGRLGRLATVEEAKRKEFATRLGAQAGGVFLYAAMVLDELLQRPPSALPDLDTYPLPDGLSGLYHDFLTRELGKDEQRWFDVYETLLGLISVAQGEGLTTQQLTGVIGKDIRAALRATRQYLSGELPDGPFRPFHKSFADFLLEDKTNTDFRIDAASMHRKIAEHLVSKYNRGWDRCTDDYALRYAPFHLAEAAKGSGAERDALIRGLVEVTSDPQYQVRCEEQLRDVPMLYGHLARAVATASGSASDDSLALLVNAGRCFIGFRREFLRGESVIGLAEHGEAEKAKSRLGLFTDLEEDWQVAAALIIAWLAIDRNRPQAIQLRDQAAGTLPSVEPLPLLLARLGAAGEGKTSYGFELHKPQDLEVGRQLVLRVSGQSFDRELLLSKGVKVVAPLNDQSEFIEGRGYAASLDGPVLVNIARESDSEGTALLDEYIDAHAGYNYVQYRNRSLWVLMHAVLRHHPGQAWVRERLKRILGAALTGGGVEFTEMAPLTAAVLLEQAGKGDPGAVVDDYGAQAFAAIGRLTSRRGANDSWSLHKRRLMALLEVHALALGDKARAGAVWNKLVGLENQRILEGFAGFQAPAELRAADGLRACAMADSTMVESRLDRALKSAHHIQDYHFCARITARCNAMRRWHRLGLEGAVLKETIERFALSAREPEFAAEHVIGEQFRFRNEDVPETETLPIWKARNADTLGSLAEVFQRLETDFLRLNPSLRLAQRIPPSTVIKVPDPGLGPLLAVHLAARTLAENSIGAERARLIRMLVPPASQNATALDTVLSYLLIATAPKVLNVLKHVVEEIGPLVIAEARAPEGQIGPDAAMPA